MTTKRKGLVGLVIVDGWGVPADGSRNAIAAAHTPYYDRIRSLFPATELVASGPRLGQPAGSLPTPEVGHLNIGSGRPASSESTRIMEAIRSGDFFENQVLKTAFRHAADEGSALHLVGMLSDAGIHSTTETLFALVRMAKSLELKDVFIHGILDGVDVPVRTADVYVEAVEIKLADIGLGKIASLCGRHFGMDSDGNWERTARAYTMLVHGEGERTLDPVGAIRGSFLRGITDEFTSPIIVETERGEPVRVVREGDTVIYFNHRPETMRQLVRSMSLPDESGSTKPLFTSVCLTSYDTGFELAVAFERDSLGDTLTDVLEESGISIHKITQTERFPHVTYYFNGLSDRESALDRHILVPTPIGGRTELKPESQSFKIADHFIRAVRSGQGGLYVANLPAAALARANGGNCIDAVQFVDTCLEAMVHEIYRSGGVAFITASHGGCEEIGDTETSDRVCRGMDSLVPLHIISKTPIEGNIRHGGSLADVAPTILGFFDLLPPPTMTGTNLLTRHATT